MRCGGDIWWPHLENSFIEDRMTTARGDRMKITREREKKKIERERKIRSQNDADDLSPLPCLRLVGGRRRNLLVPQRLSCDAFISGLHLQPLGMVVVAF